MKKVEFIEPKKEPKLVGVKRPAPIIAREDKQQLIELKKKVTKKREKKDDINGGRNWKVRKERRNEE